jgi:hypothetical protein
MLSAFQGFCSLILKLSKTKQKTKHHHNVIIVLGYNYLMIFNFVNQFCQCVCVGGGGGGILVCVRGEGGYASVLQDYLDMKVDNEKRQIMVVYFCLQIDSYTNN